MELDERRKTREGCAFGGGTWRGENGCAALRAIVALGVHPQIVAACGAKTGTLPACGANVVREDPLTHHNGRQQSGGCGKIPEWDENPPERVVEFAADVAAWRITDAGYDARVACLVGNISCRFDKPVPPIIFCGPAFPAVLAVELWWSGRFLEGIAA